MKTHLLTVVVMSSLFSSDLFAQTCDFYEDYSSDAGWEYFYYYYGVTGICLSDEQDGTLDITGGVVDFDGVDDANDTRYYHELGFSMNDDFWTASFELTPISGGWAAKTGTVIFSLSKGNESPVSDTYSICTFNNTDAIAVVWMAEYEVDPDNVGLEIWSNDNTVLVRSERLPLDYNVTYYCQLTRIATNYISLDVFLDALHTKLAASLPCFEIPSTITGLNTLQHGNFPGGSYHREFTGYLDNTCLKNIDITATAITGAETVCAESVNDYAVSSFPGAEISWEIPDGIDYTADTDTSVTITEWPAPGSYELVCVISYSCYSYTIELTVTVVEPEEGETIEEHFCEDGEVTVDVTSPDATYEWYDGTSTATHDFDEAGAYWVEVISGGCSHIDIILINEYPNPEVFLGEDDTICGMYLLDAGSGFETYSWNTGASSQTITVLEGAYTVTVTDANGCEATDAITLITYCEDYIDLPNVFSPNEDGINDFIGPLYSGPVNNYSLQIWNRWGELIYSSHDLTQSWDGTYNNEVQPIGTYVFLMHAELDDKEFQRTGNITLVR